MSRKAQARCPESSFLHCRIPTPDWQTRKVLAKRVRPELSCWCWLLPCLCCYTIEERFTAPKNNNKNPFRYREPPGAKHSHTNAHAMVLVASMAAWTKS